MKALHTHTNVLSYPGLLVNLRECVGVELDDGGEDTVTADPLISISIEIRCNLPNEIMTSKRRQCTFAGIAENKGTSYGIIFSYLQLNN